MAKRMAALGGWGHVDVYEETAHRLGEHRATVGTSMENPDWSVAHERVFEAALNRRPVCIIGLADGCMVDPRTIDLIRIRADLVMVEASPLMAQERVLAAAESQPERFPEFIEQPVPDLHTLELLYRERRPLYETATVRLDATHLSPAIAARRALTELGVPIAGR